MFGYPTTKPSDENAVDFIVRTVKAHPNEVTLLVIGPATNIALAIRKNPEIIPMVKAVVYMGGAIDVPANTTPSAEFNWWFDPEAAKISVRAPFREQWLIPHDVALRVLYTKAQYDRIGYHEGRRRSLATPADFPDGTQPVKIVFDIDRESFWDMYVELMTKSSSATP